MSPEPRATARGKKAASNSRHSFLRRRVVLMGVFQMVDVAVRVAIHVAKLWQLIKTWSW